MKHQDQMKVWLHLYFQKDNSAVPAKEEPLASVQGDICYHQTALSAAFACYKQK